jgi:hypothetical protein
MNLKFLLPAVVFGVFFCVNYPEIQYIPTVCQCLSATIIPRSYCSDVSNLPRYKSLMRSLFPITCRKDSTFCSESGPNAYDQLYSIVPITYSKNSTFCPKSGPNAYVQLYSIELNVMYNVSGQKQQQNSTYTQDFSKSLTNARVFLADHMPSSTFQCYYNPSLITEIVLDRYFNRWKWFCLICIILIICFVCLY